MESPDASAAYRHESDRQRNARSVKLRFVLTLYAAEFTHGMNWKFALAVSMGFGMVIGRHADHLFLQYTVPDIRPLMKAVLTVIGLVPLVPVLLLLPELFGEIAGYSAAGAITGVWMFYLFPCILSRIPVRRPIPSS